MKIVRGPREHGFAIIPNAALEDARLSFRARGVLAYLLSRPDGWDTGSTRLAAQGREGRDAIRAVMRELQAAGYVTRQRAAGERGQWVTVTVVTDFPRVVDNSTEDGFPGVGAPGVGGSGAASKTENKNPPTPASGGTMTACKTHKRPRRGCAPCGEPAPVRAPWCGQCDHEATRMVELDSGAVVRCHRCHPAVTP